MARSSRSPSPSAVRRPPFTETKGVRLQKAMADAGVGARRECEEMILAGRVRVNGETVTSLPYFIDPASDVVELDREVLELSSALARQKAHTPERGFAYVLINKPKGVITTTSDPEGRRTVLDFVPPALRRERLFPVGRLDADSTGLIIITNDGDFAHQLTHPKFGVTKEYRVTCAGLASGDQLQRLKRGMYLVTPTPDGTKSTKAQMESVRIVKRLVDRARGDRTILHVTLREGRNREIRRMLARIGLKVRDLERIAIGPLRAGGLKPGQSKLLGKKDVERLRAATLAGARDS